MKTENLFNDVASTLFIELIISKKQKNDESFSSGNRIYSQGKKYAFELAIKLIKDAIKQIPREKCICCNCPDCSGSSIIG